MNTATKAAALMYPSHLRAALFHSTPILDRSRRTYWNTGGSSQKGSKRWNYHPKKVRILNSKRTLLRDVGAFAEHLFKGWEFDHDEYDQSSSPSSSWFRVVYQAKGFKGDRTNNKGPQAWHGRGFKFCEDDVEVEHIFRNAFGGNGYFYWSFLNEEPHRSSSGYYNNSQTSWNWSNQKEEKYDSSAESDSSDSDLGSHRLALGLSASGPLNLEEVKNAYRTCALKWHPDRHQGSSKAVAEEKFKLCSAAYQSLCDKLALN